MQGMGGVLGLRAGSVFSGGAFDLRLLTDERFSFCFHVLGFFVVCGVGVSSVTGTTCLAALLVQLRQLTFPLGRAARPCQTWRSRDMHVGPRYISVPASSCPCVALAVFATHFVASANFAFGRLHSMLSGRRVNLVPIIVAEVLFDNPFVVSDGHRRPDKNGVAKAERSRLRLCGLAAKMPQKGGRERPRPCRCIRAAHTMQRPPGGSSHCHLRC